MRTGLADYAALLLEYTRNCSGCEQYEHWIRLVAANRRDAANCGLGSGSTLAAY